MNKATALWLVVAVTALSCAGVPPVAESMDGSPTATGSARIDGVVPEVLADRTRVVLRSNAPLLYTSYEPDARSLVLEIQDVDVSRLPELIPVDGPTVGEIAVSTEKRGKDFTVSRLEFRGVHAVDYSLRSVGTDLVVEFLPSPFPPVPAAPPAVAAVPAREPRPLLAEPSLDEEPLRAPGALEEPAARPAPEPPAGKPAPPAAERAPEIPAEPALPATRLEAVEPAPVAGGVRVDLRGNGRFDYRTFTLENPDRLVLDLVGVRNLVGTRHLQVGADPVQQVRVAQFKAAPEPVSRVVLDLVGEVPYHVTGAGEILQVVVGRAAVLARREREAEELRAAAARRAAAGPPAVEPGDGLADAGDAGATPQASPRGEDAPSDPTAGSPASNGTPAGPGPMAAPPAAEERTAPESIAAEPLAGEPEPAEAGEVPLTLEDMGLDAAGEDYVLFGQEPSYPQDVSGGLPSQFQATTISGERPSYTGEKISVHFVEAELKNVFLFFSEFIGLNIVIDPEVRGKLTMHLDQVPWDQAFDVILRHQGLEKTVEGNVVRIATTEKLRAEAAKRQALKKAQEEEVDPITFTRILSYAKVGDVVPILQQGVRTDRGRIVHDERTNTLIISDVPDTQDAYQRLIDVLDKETEQVLIEARVVETQRNFSHQLGINWGLFASADPALGTQTDLDFPHRASLNYDVTLPIEASASSLGLSLGNVLDSVTLDITLDAFESEGKARTLSSPRITTQNNQPATIEQGTQIPVVTTTAVEINVQYISASLKLEVTPQITADSTVIMDLLVENNSPSDLVVGDVPAITTQKAQTQVLVRDGGTAVIGGIFTLDESNAESGVPGLRKIPVLGWLFKSREITKDNTELLVFITPKILKGEA